MSSTPDERGYDDDAGDRTQRVPQSQGSQYDRDHPSGRSHDERDRETFGRDIDSEREMHGGIKWGAAFFGWIAAVGTATVLATAFAAVAAVVDSSTSTNLQEVTDQPTQAGVIGLVVAAVVLIIVNVCGGYVAGRMARFDGGRQGFGVWIWTLLMGAIAAALSIFLGSRFNVSGQLPGLPSNVPLVAG
ncbi:MAG: hypothetical protein WA892_01635, partial [Ornithinimicrobium sp.]